MFNLKKARILFFFLVCCSFCVPLSSQDYIHLLNGEVIEAKIKTLVGDQIQYRPFEEPESELLRVEKTEVNQVKKKNGTTYLYNRIPSDAPEEAKAPEPEEAEEKKKKLKKPVSARKLHRR